MARPENSLSQDRELQALQKECVANASKVPQAALTIFLQCHNALAWGGGWSLVSSEDQDYAMLAKGLSDFAQFKDNVRFRSVKGGVILEANPQWLLKIMSTLAPTASAAKAQEYMAKVREAAGETDKAFATYWKRVQEGKTDLFNATDVNGNKHLTGAIGVFCTNADNTLTVNGIRYKAFRMSPDAMLRKIASMPNAERVRVAVHTKQQDGSYKSTWETIPTVLSNNAADRTIAFPEDMTGKVVNRPNAVIVRLAVV